MRANTAKQDFPEGLRERYMQIRRQTELLCDPLLKEDYNLQAMPEVSPTKWHLAHTTWFFETFLLKETGFNYKPHHPLYDTLFNSYYLTVNTPHPRARRGMLSRPAVGEIFEYRHVIDERMLRLLEAMPERRMAEIEQRIELGLNHEQQHQELMLTDIKYNFFCNPLLPAYCEDSSHRAQAKTPSTWKNIEWIEAKTSIAHIGANGAEDFCFDNETPRHRVLLENYLLADRLVNNGEFLEFIDDGGYRRPELWLADGWQKCRESGWEAPLYWLRDEGRWQIYTLHGVQPLHPCDPVCHASYYEADAFARWAGARLPLEAEWERAAAALPVEGHFVCDGFLHPRAPCAELSGLRQMYGDVWEWTASAYAAYPGYTPPRGALGEYNGKFMSNQMVLRGGSCVSEREHLRATYRNFFYPADRWQFSGIRLAKSKTC